ncbi:MAG: hypothetical protein Kow0077_14100 [Anaerolineae bacterium]
MPRLRYDPDHDYYAVLGVPVHATPQEIQQAFRRLAKTYHPDRNPDRESWAKAHFQAVSEAYRVLSNPLTRREYDGLRWPHAPGTPRSAPAGGWAAQARAAYSGEYVYTDPSEWAYAEQARRRQPPPPEPAYSAASPTVSLRTLLRGPYSSVYVIALIIVLFLPVAYLTGLRIQGYTLNAVVGRAAEALPDPACIPGTVDITAPVDGATVAPRFAVSGTASTPDMAAYALEWAYLGFERTTALADADWQAASEPASQPVEGGLLGEVQLPGDTGIYALRLIVVQGNGRPLPPCVRIVASQP